MKAQLTLKDIALHFNLSVSTVSRALRDDPTISRETKDKIAEYAKIHKYKPNFIASNLRKQESNVIGIIIPEISNHFFSLIIAGVESVVDNNNYTLIITQSDERLQKEIKCVQTLLSSRVAGIMASISKTTDNLDHFKEVVDNGVPLVFFDRCPVVPIADRVIINDEEGAFMAVEYLIKTGCKRIAYFGSHSSIEIAINRKKGYIRALETYGIAFDKKIIYDCDTNEKAKEITADVLNSRKRPDAIFAINDNTAAGVIYIAKRLGISIPDELAVCGFGDGYISTNTDPSITSIDQFPFFTGKKAVERLLYKIKNPELKNDISTMIIDTSLILRASTGNIVL